MFLYKNYLRKSSQILFLFYSLDTSQKIQLPIYIFVIYKINFLTSLTNVFPYLDLKVYVIDLSAGNLVCIKSNKTNGMTFSITIFLMMKHHTKQIIIDKPVEQTSMIKILLIATL